MTREEAKKIISKMLAYTDLTIRANLNADMVSACNLAIKSLEQEPRKGHWILTDVEGDRVWHCHCSECGKDPQDYVGGSENWWLIKSKLPEFCPSCGSDNREVVEE